MGIVLRQNHDSDSGMNRTIYKTIPRYIIAPHSFDLSYLEMNSKILLWCNFFKKNVSISEKEFILVECSLILTI